MNNSLYILLIEDDADDVELLRDALNNSNIQHTMQVINNGGAASVFLKTNTAFPDIIVMDLNIPKVHGMDVLREVRASSLYNNIPVIILTTSSSPEDRKKALELGANDFLIKPTTSQGLYEVASLIAKVTSHNH